MTFAEKVLANIQERTLLEPGEKLLVAVSGGVDSVVLLHVLHELAATHHWPLIVAHFNHQLRGSASDRDEQFVADLSATFQLPFIPGAGDVRSAAEKTGASLEMAARQLRHEFLAQAASQTGASKILLGHHADDQVELFLLRLLRGSAGQALTGMKWKAPSPADDSLLVVRPFLNLPRAEILRFAQAQKIQFQHDQSNDELHFERNKVRHKLLPFLKETFAQNIEWNILRVIEVLRAEKEFLRGEAERAQASAPFELCHPALQRQILFAGLLQLQVTPDFDLIEQLRTRPDTPITVSPGCVVKRDHQGRVQRKSLVEFKLNENSLPVDLAARNNLEFDNVLLSWRFLPFGEMNASEDNVERFDADKVGSKIILRHWQPGDRFQPIGMQSSVKLQDFFTNAHIHAPIRRNLILAANEQGEIFWVESIRISENFKITPKTKTVLEWRWNRAVPLAT